MISLSKLLCDLDAEGDGLRYDAADDAEVEQIRQQKQQKPVVVWNVTKRCNLYCQHCYASADTATAPGELTTAEGEALLDDLADYGAPVVLFSGGEPMVRDDLVELIEHASDAGLRPVLSTNGTLITAENARRMKEAGLKYAGVSVDGLPERSRERARDRLARHAAWAAGRDDLSYEAEHYDFRVMTKQERRVREYAVAHVERVEPRAEATGSGAAASDGGGVSGAVRYRCEHVPVEF